MERQRVAALTPEQRAVEEKVKEKENAVAGGGLRQRKVRVRRLKKRRRRQPRRNIIAGTCAAAAAKMLKQAMKDPEAFSLTSLLLMPDGAACYEYRAKNSFGAILPGSAVLTTAGKMLTHEHNGNAFVNAWNKTCTVSGGEELSALMKMSGVL